MKISYSTFFSRKCPVDGTIDHYQCELTSHETIFVEAILEQIDELPEAATPEELTQILASELDCTVTTTGWHSGVKTVVTV